MDAIKNESNLIPDSAYDTLISSGVNCSHCERKLSDTEIVMHKHVGITTPEDMMCQADWMRVAYMVDVNE